MPTWFWVGVGFVALAVIALTLTTGTVEADALLSGAKATPVASAATPALKTAAQAQQTATKVLEGVASWYGPKFDGLETASGERYNMNALTAAQPNLPFGTKVRVENLANHKSVVVRINDRGYLPGKRVLDLSYAAARRLAMTHSGLAEVKVTVLPEMANQ